MRDLVKNLSEAEIYLVGFLVRYVALLVGVMAWGLCCMVMLNAPKLMSNE